MAGKVWTSLEARQIFSELQMQLLEAEGDAARLLQLRCDWLEEEFSRTDHTPEACSDTGRKHRALAG